VVSALIAAIFVHHDGKSGIESHLPGQWSLIPLCVIYLGGILLRGRTFGMYLLGLRIIRVDANLAIGPGRALVRTLLLILLLPALFLDRDLRGLHDRFTDTAVIVH
jgi:uncharacterized RDD family membrane protein YckC